MTESMAQNARTTGCNSLFLHALGSIGVALRHWNIECRTSVGQGNGQLGNSCVPQTLVQEDQLQGKLASSSLFAIMALALATVQPLCGQQPTGQARKLTESPGATAVYEDTQWSPDQDIELLKSNIRSQKKQIVAANMDLNDTEAEKFWLVYNRYAADLAKIYDTKIALFQEYLETNQTMSGDQAENYLRRRAAVEQDVMQVRLKYLPEFRKVLTGRETALFYQIDWRLDLMINLQLAQAPMINP